MILHVSPFNRGSAMFSWLWAIIDRIKRLINTFFGWCRDPWAGGHMTRPLTREFTNTGESLVYILVHRTGSAIYSALYVVIFEGLATVAKFTVGILSDIIHSDYKYGRYLGGLLLSALQLAAEGVVTALRVLFKLIEKLVSSLLR